MIGVYLSDTGHIKHYIETLVAQSDAAFGSRECSHRNRKK